MGLFSKLFGNDASLEELKDEYEKERQKFLKTGNRSKRMDRLNDEISRKAAERDHKEHPEWFKPGYRWTDKNRWE